MCETCGASYTSKVRFVQHLRAKHPEIPPESVIPLVKRTGEGRLVDRLRQERQGYEKKARGPNKKTRSRRSTSSQPEIVQEPQLALNVVNTNESIQVQFHPQAPAPAHMSISAPLPPAFPYQSQLSAHQQQPYSNFAIIPNRQLLPDPREWNWQWQAQAQNQPFQPHPHQPFFQYHQQPTEEPTNR